MIKISWIRAGTLRLLLLAALVNGELLRRGLQGDVMATGVETRDSGNIGNTTTCNNGFEAMNGKCVCSSKCPLFSRPRRSIECPFHIRRHCVCEEGYSFVGDSCEFTAKFNRRLPPIEATGTNTYSSCGALRRDVKKALQYAVDTSISMQLDSCNRRRNLVETAEIENKDATTNSMKVENARKPGTVRLDGEIVFEAYSNRLSMLTLQRDLIDRVRLPSGTRLHDLFIDISEKMLTGVGVSERERYQHQSVAYMFSYESGKLKQIRRLDFPGIYKGSRSIDGRIDIVTEQSLNTLDLFRGLEYDCLQPPEVYKETAFLSAKQKMASTVQAVLKGIDIGFLEANGSCQNILQISTMRDSDGQSRGVDDPIDLGRLKPLSTLVHEFFRSFVLVSSFDISKEANISAKGDAMIQTAGVFGPPGIFGLLDDHSIVAFSDVGPIVIAELGWSLSKKVWKQKTFLISFASEHGKALTPSSVLSLDGQIAYPTYTADPTYIRRVREHEVDFPREGSLDFHHGFVRVMTSTTERWKITKNGVLRRFVDTGTQIFKVAADVRGGMNLTGRVNVNVSNEDRPFSSVLFLGNHAYITNPDRPSHPNGNIVEVVDMEPDVPRNIGIFEWQGNTIDVTPFGRNREYILRIYQERRVRKYEDKFDLKASLFNVSQADATPQEIQSVIIRDTLLSRASFLKRDENSFIAFVLLGSNKLVVKTKDNTRSFHEYDVDPKDGFTLVNTFTKEDIGGKIRCLPFFAEVSSFLPEPHFFSGDGVRIAEVCLGLERAAPNVLSENP